MKAFYLSFLLLASPPLLAQQSKIENTTANESLISDQTILSVTKYEMDQHIGSPAKPILITAQDKKLYTRPVYQNPNYKKVMPLKDPNEVEIEDKN
jgi:predicted transcriptional regulator